MDEKDKALELISDLTMDNTAEGYRRAIKCALVCVDEIIEEVRDYCDDRFHQDRLTYWKEVRKELEILKD